MKCPGQDRRFWDLNSIFDAQCPVCGYSVEFFKDDISRICKNCKSEVCNPKLDLGCAEHCQFAEICTGKKIAKLT